MKKILCQILIILSFSFFWTLPVYSQITQIQKDEIAQKVKRAFDPSRQFDYKWSEEILPYGKKIIPYIIPYINSSDVVKAQVLELLKTIKEPESIPPLLQILNSNNLTLSLETAAMLCDNYDHKMLSERADVAEALRQNVVTDKTSLTTIVLLGYFPGEETEKALLAAKPTKTFGYWTNTKDFYAPVKYPLPVTLSLYRINPQVYAEKLAALIKKANYGETEFLLYSLNYIDDKELLKLIFEKGIKSTRMRDIEVGIHGEIFPNSMRVIDLTVCTFAQKFNINPGFKIDEQRYSQAKINILRRKIVANLNTRQ